MDEANGNALDAVGSNDLIETSGLVGSSPGVINYSCELELNDTEYFSIPDNPSISTGDSDFPGYCG